MEGVLHHGEKRLVGVNLRLDAIWFVETELWTCFAESGGVLCCCEDGDVEDAACVILTTVIVLCVVGEA